ncbi:MAG: type IV pilus modification protein PilV [Gammaproteobacteria bacterium]|nr:type IV pilus modification protein PilV [Gammaproteobacteria bacterium]
MHRLKPPRLVKGFTLLEVLITVVIFSVGLLGLAGLQATGIKVNHSSLLRTQATMLAYEIADCMRTNKGDDLILNKYEVGFDDDYSSPGNMAEEDIKRWKLNLARALPGGLGAVQLENDLVRVTIDVQWDDTRGIGSSKSFRLVTDI